MDKNINKNLNPKNISFSKNITKDSFTNGILDNTFIIFNSINNLLLLIYSNRKSFITFNLINNKKINEIKNAHSEDISNFRHCLDKINKIDYIISISKINNNIKLWNVMHFECLLNIEKINKYGILYSSCFLHDNNNIYIITSNWNFIKADNIKVFDLKGNKLNEIKNSNEGIFYIDTYYDKNLSKIYIITNNKSYIKSYDYKQNILYHYYSDNMQYIEHCSPIIYNKNNLVELIDICTEGIIRIWNFNTGDLINKIQIMKLDPFHINGVCLWNDDYIYIGCDDKEIKLIEIKSGNIINNLKGHTECVLCIKKINHPNYGECIISQGRGFDQIRLWVDKVKYK